MTKQKTDFMVKLASYLAIVVVVLGAYTRLTNAGLGCPDWPGCYGHLVLSGQAPISTALGRIQAWTEMIHRYAAMTLGLSIAFIFFSRLRAWLRGEKTISIPALLVLLVIFQAMLGMWTVTLKLLPVVVMGHLLGGLTIAALLWSLRFESTVKLQQAPPIAYRKWVFLGCVILFTQIALGGWVSANYAGIACTGFPACNGLLFPHLNLPQAFDVFSPIGANYQGGLLDIQTRITIQMVHRIGAIVTFSYWLALAFMLRFRTKHHALQQAAEWVIVLVCAQFMLGVFNVMYLLPLKVAVMHNAVALMLLISVVRCMHCFRKRGWNDY